MTLEALIFDVDGTLADTEEIHRVAFNLAFERHGLGWSWNRKEYRELLKVAGGKERLAAFICTLPIDAEERKRLTSMVAPLHAEKTRFYSSLVADGAVLLREGVRALLDEALACGYRLGIATTTTALNVDALLAATLGPRGRDMFSVIACGDQVRAKKPAPDIYRLALANLDILAEQAIGFEDSANGLASAVAAGLWTVVTPTVWTEGSDFSAAGMLCADLQAVRLADITEVMRTSIPQHPLGRLACTTN